MVGLDFLKKCSVASAKYMYTDVSFHIQALRFGNTILLEYRRFRVHIAKRVFHKPESFKMKPITYQKPQMFGMYPQIDLSTKTIESIDCL